MVGAISGRWKHLRTAQPLPTEALGYEAPPGKGRAEQEVKGPTGLSERPRTYDPVSYLAWGVLAIVGYSLGVELMFHLWNCPLFTNIESSNEAS